MSLPNLVKTCIFIKKFHNKEKPMFGIEPNLDKVFGGMLNPQSQKLVDYAQYLAERNFPRYTLFGRKVVDSDRMWHECTRFWFDRKNMVIIPELSPYKDVIGAKLFPDTLRSFGINA